MSATTAGAIRKMAWVLGLTAVTANANPLMVLGGVNGVIDAVKRTTAPLAAVQGHVKPADRPRISLPGANQIERSMRRDAVLAIVGAPAATEQRGGKPAAPVRDVYKVNRDGPCAVDQVEISYLPYDGVVDQITQKCGDVTSNENRTAMYSFRRELPAAFDRVRIDMPRDEVIEVLGTPAETRQANSPQEFLDVYLFGEEKALLTYIKGNKQLQHVVWGGAQAPLPRIQRSGVFESAPQR